MEGIGIEPKAISFQLVTVQTSARSLVTREFVESSLKEEKQMNALTKACASSGNVSGDCK
jgi:hypothetical protein